MDAPEDHVGVLSRFREGPFVLEATVKCLSDGVLDFKPSRGGWTIREILHHVVDGDDLWKLAIKMAMGSDDVEFSLGWYWTMSQENWGDRWAYGSRSIGASLTLLKSTREHILQLLENAPGVWNRAVLLRKRDGQIERIPIGFILKMQGDHLFHHLTRIHEIVLEQRGP
jgi:uncharacterized damage-inducible protein DinB